MKLPFNQKGFIPIHLIIGGIILITLAGSAYYFTRANTPRVKVQKTPPIKQTSQPQSTTIPSPTTISTQQATPSSSTSTPTPPGPTTVTQISNYVTINFIKCAPGRVLVPVGLGSTTYIIKGLQGKYCLFEYSGEIEMGATPTYNCKVPEDIGESKFEKKNTGVNFDPIQQYCTKK